jgi:hypothetical protein
MGVLSWLLQAIINQACEVAHVVFDGPRPVPRKPKRDLVHWIEINGQNWSSLYWYVTCDKPADASSWSGGVKPSDVSLVRSLDSAKALYPLSLSKRVGIFFFFIQLYPHEARVHKKLTKRR